MRRRPAPTSGHTDFLPLPLLDATGECQAEAAGETVVPMSAPECLVAPPSRLPEAAESERPPRNACTGRTGLRKLPAPGERHYTRGTQK